MNSKNPQPQGQNPKDPSVASGDSKTKVPQNQKGGRPENSESVDPSVSGTSASSHSAVLNPEAELQDKNGVGQD